MGKVDVVSITGLLALIVLAIVSCGGQSAVDDPFYSPPEIQLADNASQLVDKADSPRTAAGRGGTGTGGGNAGPMCISCHPNPPEDEDASWDDAPGDHAACFECHKPVHGDSPNPAGLLCLNCHQDDWENAHAPGATDCLICHLYPHLPNTDFTDCESCHVTPPENPEVSWDAVVSGHRQCTECHTGSHGMVPPYSDEFCITCHPEYAGAGNHGGATCKDCHEFAHLMTMGWLCSKCHNY